MLYQKADPEKDKGWYYGPWNTDLQVSVGYANAGVDEPHYHLQMSEVYMAARGQSTLRVEQQTVILQPGDVVVIQPGEAHTFLSSTPDYFHFVVHTPALPPEAARADKHPVPRARLGLKTKTGVE